MPSSYPSGAGGKKKKKEKVVSIRKATETCSEGTRYGLGNSWVDTSSPIPEQDYGSSKRLLQLFMQSYMKLKIRKNF